MAEQATSTEAARQEPSAPEYGASYFANYWGGGGPYERNERWLEFFGKVAEGLVRDLHPSSVLDAGCAMGFLVEELRKRGVDASGVDVSEYAISAAHESVAEHVRVGSLSEPLGRRYDLIVCIEVLEHVPAAEIDRVLDNLGVASDRLVISTTPGDFGEATHLNVQPPEYWSAKLAERGFARDLDRDLSYVSPWAALYVREDEANVLETVRRYDRSWWRLRSEASEVRKALLASQQKIAELEASPAPEPQAELRAELENSNEEVLRLRDLLIAKEIELGAARGKVAELEDRWERIVGVKSNFESKVPLLGTMLRLLRWPLRLLRGRR